MKNNEIASVNENTVKRKSIILPGFFSPSNIEISDDQFNVATPIFKASNKPIIPLNIGNFKILYFSTLDINSVRLDTISPFWFLAAAAYAPGTLIMTPSIIACPPTRIDDFVRIIYRCFKIKFINFNNKKTNL